MADKPQPRQIDFGFLSDASSRLQRFLGVSGELSPKVRAEPELLPVLLAGDLTLPGYGNAGGRRFVAGTEFAAGAGNLCYIGYKATVDCIIEMMDCWYTVGTQLVICYLGPNDADPFAMTTAAGLFIDRAASANEVAPLTVGTSNVNIGIPSGSFRRLRVNNAALGVPVTYYDKFFMLAGSKIILLDRNASNNTLSFNVAGRAP